MNHMNQENGRLETLMLSCSFSPIVHLHSLLVLAIWFDTLFFRFAKLNKSQTGEALPIPIYVPTFGFCIRKLKTYIKMKSFHDQNI